MILNKYRHASRVQCTCTCTSHMQKGCTCKKELSSGVVALLCLVSMNHSCISESVDSLCRDGADTPIVRVHTKAF